jgi:TolA-binding protein
MNDNFEKMDRYFEGHMSDAEKEAFEQRCKHDENLAEELALYITIHDHIKQQWITERKQELEMLEQEVEEEFANIRESDGGEQEWEAIEANRTLNVSVMRTDSASPKKRNLYYRFAAAAALLAFIIISITWYRGSQNKEIHIATSVKPAQPLQPIDSVPAAARANPRLNYPTENIPIKPPIPKKTSRRGRDLFKENFTPEPPPSSPAPELQNALALYEQKNYPAAITALDKLQNEQLRGGEMTDEEELTFFYIPYYKAQIHLSRGNAKKAVAELQSAIKRSPSAELTANAKWYMALAYLEQENIKDAKVLLRQLSADSTNSKRVFRRFF